MLILKKMADFTSTITYESLKPETIQRAKFCIIDTLGVALKGTTHNNAQLVYDAMTKMRGTNGLASIWGKDSMNDPTTAAMINAYAAHADDYDDTCYAGMTHPSAVILPALLALGQYTNASGKDIIAAMVAGWEISGRLGLALPKLIEYGWQSGSLFGTWGAVAAGARVMKLSPEQTLHAISLALCQIGGMRESNGTAAKPYTLATASANAVLACIHAREGITGSVHMLEGSQGYFKLFGKDEQLLTPFECMANPYIIDSPGVCVKKYPVCSSAHSAIQAALELRKNIESIDDIKEIICGVTPTVLQYLRNDVPKTILEAQFSLPYLVATSIKNGFFDGREHLSDAALQDPHTKQLMQKLSYAIDTSIDGQKYPEASCITIITKQAQRMYFLVEEAHGFPGQPFDAMDHENKFMFCVDGVLNAQTAQTCIKTVMELEQHSNMNMLFRLLH